MTIAPAPPLSAGGYHPTHLTGSSTTHARVGHDFYATPPYATNALIDTRELAYASLLWEPACGNGAMASVLRERLAPVHLFASDIRDAGYGVPHVDFLADGVQFADRILNEIGVSSIGWIVTNPPYSHAEEFLAQALKIAPNVALLLKLNFLEGQKRYKLFQAHPPNVVYVFSRRLSFDDGNVENPRDAGLLAYAWFVWRQDTVAPSTRLEWIAP